MTSRISTAKLKLLIEELPHRYTPPLAHLARTRVLTGAHLDRLLDEPPLSAESVGRMRRRIMTRLHRAGLVHMLRRRIGGVRAGSAGHVYTLTNPGRAFLAIRDGAPIPPRTRQLAREPGELFLHHALAISGIYVDLMDASRAHRSRVPTFRTEPQCWHPLGEGAYLRPDAYTVLRTATHADCWWLETDQATESIPRLRTKIRAYGDYLTSGGVGPDAVPPRVLFSTPDQARADAIADLVGVEDLGRLIAVCTHERAAPLMITELQTG